MPYTATVTQNNVVLPDGTLHQAGDRVLLTDTDWQKMSAAVRAAVLSTIAAVNTATAIPS